ncbi:SHOCT domain-containing protein, partial [Bifidobacterium margollesii]
ERGISLIKASITAIDYDLKTKELISTVQRADALMGTRGNSNLQASFAQGLQSAGSSPDGSAIGMAFMNMAMNGITGATTINTQQPLPNQPTEPIESPYEKLEQLKKLVDKGILSKEEFDLAKKKILGI